MNCKCIEEINLKLREATKDPEAKLSVIFTFDGPKVETRLFVPYTYRLIKKDGTFTQKKEGELALSKCPFCGTAIEKDKKKSGQ
jgi:hypothetical protein